jgi:L-methionine (R)-S-oxide reductase
MTAQMSETIQDMRSQPRCEAYAELDVQTRALLEGIDDPIAAMATISSLIHGAFGHLWTGFYRVVVPDRLLRVGPYQGTIGCLDIEFGKGVCGTAAAKQHAVIVDDVASFEGHITCDPRTRSEIVVPVFGKSGDLIAVFDVDSEQAAAFTSEDQKGLEMILEWFRRTA